MAQDLQMDARALRDSGTHPPPRGSTPTPGQKRTHLTWPSLSPPLLCAGPAPSAQAPLFICVAPPACPPLASTGRPSAVPRPGLRTPAPPLLACASGLAISSPSRPRLPRAPSPAPPHRDPALFLASLLERASLCALTNGMAAGVARPGAVRRDKRGRCVRP